VPLVPDGRTIRQDQTGPNRTNQTPRASCQLTIRPIARRERAHDARAPSDFAQDALERL
jgi:hypothetical protein